MMTLALHQARISLDAAGVPVGAVLAANGHVIAAGVVFESMCYVSGRRPPHAAERSRDLLRRFSEQGLRAELLADLVASVAALETMTQDKIRQLARAKLAVLPDCEIDAVEIAAAARAMQVEAARWARLRVGEELSYEWPGKAG